MYSEDDLLPISALQHLLFCERQCALIHVEQAWAENRLTVEGRIMHDRVHACRSESRRDVRVVTGVRLRSLRVGLTGQADVVEFHREEVAVSQAGDVVAVRLSETMGWWRPFPVEYKRGLPKGNSCDEIQLCAQALCLEEMLGVVIRSGVIFYGETRRRLDVECDAGLRQQTERAAVRLRDLIRGGLTPAAQYGKMCEHCSLMPVCMPKTASGRKSVKAYLNEAAQGG